nr:immunoglobulin heavy chain junction region [Mus musculus]
CARHYGNYAYFDFW